MNTSADTISLKTSEIARGTMQAASHQGLVICTIRAEPVPEKIAEFLRSNVSVIRQLQTRLQTDHFAVNSINESDGTNEVRAAVSTNDMVGVSTVQPEKFWDVLGETCRQFGGEEWIRIADSIWAFGPHGAGECMLIDAREDVMLNS